MLMFMLMFNIIFGLFNDFISFLHCYGWALGLWENSQYVKLVYFLSAIFIIQPAGQKLSLNVAFFPANTHKVGVPSPNKSHLLKIAWPTMGYRV